MPAQRGRLKKHWNGGENRHTGGKQEKQGPDGHRAETREKQGKAPRAAATVHRLGERKAGRGKDP
ncbi:MAG: hypothetical protein ACFFD4_19035 [Candidatus Odinarchaeota archaeon]